MLLLLTNDDGYQAAGLQALRKALATLGRVITVAPANEMSGVSHALTLARPLSVEEIDRDLWAVDGTPTDCVNIGLNRLVPEPPAACISGINHGQNLGDDVSYSGTVGAACEATLFGIPALAVSQLRGTPHSDFTVAARLATELAGLLAWRVYTLPTGTFLNLNVPETAPAGVSATRLARRIYLESAAPQDGALGRTYHWLGGRPVWQSAPGTDHHAVVTLGHASLSLLGTDLSLAVPAPAGAPPAEAEPPCLDRGLEPALRALEGVLGGDAGSRR
jgi:5'-nucleotidase